MATGEENLEWMPEEEGDEHKLLPWNELQLQKLCVGLLTLLNLFRNCHRPQL